LTRVIEYLKGVDMEQIPILAPAAVLVLWSLVVLMWMTATRFPAFAKAGLKIGEAEPGSRYVDVEPAMPSKVNWKSQAPGMSMSSRQCRQR
jgi:hypothetical protein